MIPFYGNANKYKSKGERMEVLSVYRKVLLKLLKQGYNPFADNTERYVNQQQKGAKIPPKSKVGQHTRPKEKLNKTEALPSTAPNPPHETPTGMPLKEALEKSINLKTKLVGEHTLSGYKICFNILLKY